MHLYSADGIDAGKEGGRCLRGEIEGNKWTTKFLCRVLYHEKAKHEDNLEKKIWIEDIISGTQREH